jgi:minor extracellular serine protease Vpr
MHSARLLRSVLLFGFIILGCAPLSAQRASNRYALILSDPPAAARFSSRASLMSAQGLAYRQSVERAQSGLRQELNSRKIRVAGSVSTLLNAVFVVATPDKLDELKALPGVIGVLPMRTGRRLLNNATQLMNAPAAWAMPAINGQQNAGKGIKIGILDTGIDQTHPAFQDSSLAGPGSPYPICTQGHPEDCAYTNNKVIVARSYVRQIAAGSETGAADPATSQPDDYSPRDRDGHGTAVAASAAANPTTGGTVPINGMAPKAWLGNYKIYGSTGVNDFPPEDVWIKAIEDALNDGMDIVNFSSGTPAISGAVDQGAACGQAAGVPCDALAAAFESAAQHGMVVVTAAGNEGTNYTALNPYPVFNSVGSPAHAPSVLAVGATINSHAFGPTVTALGNGATPDLVAIEAIPSDSTPLYPALGAFTAPLVDASWVGDGYACSAFPAGSLQGAFALVQRGPTGANACTFATKAVNVQDAGALGMIMYMAADSAPLDPNFVETVQDFFGPVVGVSNAVGVALKAFADSRAAADKAWPMAVIDLAGKQRAPDATANQLAGYSSFGPALASIGVCPTCSKALAKPDLVATGGGDTWLTPDPGDFNVYGFPGLYLPGQNYDPMGWLYSTNRYVAADGTSFASPLAAGTAALVKQAHPNYSGAQIRSALVNYANASGTTTDDSGNSVDVRGVGAGLLDAASAVKATVAASPTSVAFGAIASTGTVPPAQTVTLTNMGSSSVTLAVSVQAQTSGATVTADKQSITLGAAGSGTETGTLNVSISGSVPPAKSYSGNIALTGTGVSMHIPYLFLVGSGTIGNTVPIFGTTMYGIVGQNAGAFAIQALDDNGVPVTGKAIEFSVSDNLTTLQSAPGAVACAPASSNTSLSCPTDNYGVAYVQVVLGPTPGEKTIVATPSGSAPTYLYAEARFQPVSAAVLDAAQGRQTVAPGSYASIYGSNLSDSTGPTTAATLPLTLNNVTVSFDTSSGLSLPGHVLYTSANQVNVQVPWELQGSSSAQVKVTVNQNEYGTLVTVPLADIAPSFFETATNNVAALVAGTATIINSGSRAAKGQNIQLLANGLGPVQNGPATGDTAASGVSTTNGCTVTIGGQTAPVTFCGLAPGTAGLYRVDVTVPQGAASGTQPVVLTVAGKTATSSIPIQ